MSEACPKCGASAAATWHSDYNGTAIDYMCGHTIYADGTETQGKDCYDRQLAQAKARIAELEDDCKRMREALRPFAAEWERKRDRLMIDATDTSGNIGLMIPIRAYDRARAALADGEKEVRDEQT